MLILTATISLYENINMDKIDLMRVFSTVARHGGFTNAAGELDMAVQTVSKYVKELEEQLGVQLFDRTTRKVSLNDTGVAYLDRCKDLLEQFDELESSIQAEHRAPKGRIRISAPTVFGEKHLVPRLAKFQVLYPEIVIDLDLSTRKVSLVDEGFDLGIRIGTLDDSSMIARKLNDIRISIGASPEYLEKYGKPIHPMELTKHNCLIETNFRFGKRWPFLIDGKKESLEVDGSFLVNSPDSIRRLMLAGLGIGICPTYVVKEDVDAGHIVLLFQNMEALNFGVYAIYPHRKHLSNRVRTLVDFLITQFEQF